ncbi:MAG: hypothetical protein STSR0008_14020 [Ignavibacterium sp.]
MINNHLIFQNDIPLISIIVLTYNSEKFVIETLDSIKIQTYDKIELIITDDSSTDRTISVVYEWIKKNSDCFLQTEVIISKTNTGLPSNINRGIKRAHGEWIKIVAGDDILLKDCILYNVDFVLNNKFAEIVFSRLITFDSTNQDICYNYNEDFFGLNCEMQLKRLLCYNQISAPTIFIKKSTVINLNFFDEKYYLLDDYPFWIKALNSGIKIYGFDFSTCKYRIHDKNTSLTHRKGEIFNIKFHHELMKFYWREIISINIRKKYFFNVIYILFYTILSEVVILNFNKKNFLNNLFLVLDKKIKNFIIKTF